jgi:hypothetical protein
MEGWYVGTPSIKIAHFRRNHATSPVKLEKYYNNIGRWSEFIALFKYTALFIAVF